MKDILDELKDSLIVSPNSNSYKLLSTQISQKIRDGVDIENIITELNLQGYKGDEIKNTVYKLYNRNKKEANELLAGLTKSNVLYLKSLLEDSIRNDNTKNALEIIKELNKMIPKKIDKDIDGEQIVISFS